MGSKAEAAYRHVFNRECTGAFSSTMMPDGVCAMAASAETRDRVELVRIALLSIR